MQSETAKHRYAVAQVITYVVVALIVVVAAVGVVDRLGIPSPLWWHLPPSSALLSVLVHSVW
ncbi:MAG: hypothetical protein U1U88_002084 [Lawsonella clevelandensis]